MARIIIVDCDWDEYRAAVVDASGSSLSIIAAHTFPRVDNAAELRKQLRSLLGDGKGAKLDLAAVVGRRDVEFKPMSLPPAPENELPAMVQFQAQREMTTPESGPLDFLPLASGGAGNRVIAVRISPTQFKMLTQAAEELGGKTSCVSVRAAAVAALVELRLSEAQRPLIVDVRGDTVDATIIEEGRAAFFRNFRISGESEAERAGSLALQIRQSFLAAQADGAEAESIVLCGDGAMVAGAAERLSGDGMRVFKFSTAEAAGGVPSDLRVDLDRYAAVLGTAHLATRGKPCINFANPRKPPPPPDRTKNMRLAAIGALAVVAAGALWFVQQSRRYDGELSNLKSSIRGAKERIAEFETDQLKLAELAVWQATDVSVLDEMALLSERVPPADEVMFGGFEYSASSRGAGAKLTLSSARARDENARKATEERLRVANDVSRAPVGGQSSVGGAPPYPVQFSETIQLRPVAAEQYLEWMETEATETPAAAEAPEASPNPSASPPDDSSVEESAAEETDGEEAGS